MCQFARSIIILDLVSWCRWCLICQCEKLHAFFFTKTMTHNNILFGNMTCIALALGNNYLLSIFILRLTKQNYLYQRNPMLVELFSYVNTFVGFFMLVIYFAHRNLGQWSEKYTFQKHRWFWSKKREGTELVAKLQLSVCAKSHTCFMKTCP